MIDALCAAALHLNVESGIIAEFSDDDDGNLIVEAPDGQRLAIPAAGVESFVIGLFLGRTS